MNGSDGIRDSTFTAADVAIIEGIRRGLRDDEIAIVVRRDEAWVAGRIGYLLAELGLADRWSLGAWNPWSAVSEAERPVPPSARPAETFPGHKPSRRTLLVGGAIAGGALAFGAWLRAGSGNPTLTFGNRHQRTPAVTRTATPTPAFDLAEALYDARSEVEFVQLSAGATLAATQGVFLMDPVTGDVEGVALEERFASGLSGIITHQFSHDTDRVLMMNYKSPRTPERGWLARRSVGLAWGWQARDLNMVAALEDRLVFEQAVGTAGASAGRPFYVMDFSGPSPVLVNSFTVSGVARYGTGPWWLSANGERMVGWVTAGTGQRRLVRVVLESGEEDIVMSLDSNPEAGSSVRVALIDDPDLFRITSTSTNSDGSTSIETADAQWDGPVALHFEPRPEQEPIGYPSPDGAWLARDEPLRRSGSEVWPGIAFEPTDGRSPGIHVRSASLPGVVGGLWAAHDPRQEGLTVSHGPWLVDSSAVVAVLAPELPRAEYPAWENIGFALVGPKGDLVARIPNPPGFDRWGFRENQLPPVPSPTNPALLTFAGRFVYNWRDETWVVVDAPAPIYSGEQNWLPDGSKTVFMLPNELVGSPGFGRPVLLPMRAASPLDADEPLTVVAAVPTTVRASPGSGAEVLIEASAGERMTVAELPETEAFSDGRRAVDFLSNVTWIRVATEGGVTGWIDVSHVVWPDS